MALFALRLPAGDAWTGHRRFAMVGFSGRREFRAEPCDGGGLSGERPQPDGPMEWPLLLSAPLRADLLRRDSDRAGGEVQRHDARPCTRGPALGGLLYATIEGHRDGAGVFFIKTYDGTGGWTHSVTYEGRLNSDGTEIEGRWTTSGWSGKFLMLRPTEKDASAEGEATERSAAEPVGRP